jgi:hypothetical protein
MECVLRAKLRAGKLTPAEHEEMLQRDRKFREHQLEFQQQEAARGQCRTASKVDAEAAARGGATTKTNIKKGLGQKIGHGEKKKKVHVFRWTGANDFFMYCNNARGGGGGG